MGVLQRFERRIEDMVNRPFARAFKAEVQPVEIASALQRECDDRAAIVARGRTMVPNAFTVALGPHDHERLSVYAEALGQELAAMVREHAEEQRYAFIGPVTRRRSSGTSELPTGRFQVRSAAEAGADRSGDRHRRAGGHHRHRGPVGRGRQHDVRAGQGRDPDRARHRHRPAHRRPRHLAQPRRAAPVRRRRHGASTWAPPTASSWTGSRSASSACKRRRAGAARQHHDDLPRRQTPMRAAR